MSVTMRVFMLHPSTEGKKVSFTDGLYINQLTECGCFDSDLDEAKHTSDNKAARKRRGKQKW